MQRKPDEEHGRFYVTQSVALFNREGELLALRHRDGKWLLVGGHMNKGEGWQAALEREIREEIGFADVELSDVLEVDSWESAEGPQYGVFFLGKLRRGCIALGDEHTEYIWLKSVEEVERLDWWVSALRERALAAWKKVHSEK